MANHHQQPASPAGMHLHHGPPGRPQVNGHMPMQGQHKLTPAHLAQLNEAVWLGIGTDLLLSFSYPLPSTDILHRKCIRAHERP